MATFALLFSLNGCGESGSVSSSASSQESVGVDQLLIPDTTTQNVNDGVGLDSASEYGISSELGTPPKIPFS